MADGDLDLEGGFAGGRGDGDGAVVAFDDDALGDVQAEAGAFADVLGGIESLEGPGGDFRV